MLDHPSADSKVNTIGPHFRGNAYKGEPDIRAIMPRSKKNAGFSNNKKFQYKSPRYKSSLNTSKGSFCSRKKIIKVSFPGVAVWGSCGVGELQIRGVAVWASCGVGAYYYMYY